MSTMKQKYQALVEKIYNKTDAKELTWKVDPLDDAVLTIVAGRTIEFVRTENEQSDPIVRVIIRAGNDVVEKFDDEDLAGLKPSVGGFDSFWPLMIAVVETATRQAKGVDEVLDEILDELDNGPF